MPEEYVSLLQTTGKNRRIGNKAQNLRFLAARGFAVPRTYVCSWDAHARYVEGDIQVLEALRTELEAKLDSGKEYAIRSSANVEDEFDSSFAGQFKSMLDVQGVDEILQAVSSVWATTQSPAVQAYLEQKVFAPRDLKMAVIIQEMISARVSGVAFSKNPITGLDEVLVEAVRGSGEALVQEGVTPYRWISKWGAWVSKPDEPLDGQDMSLELMEDVVRQTREIARAYGRPVDLEWVYDGRELTWVQLRPITSLDIPVYSNRISKEVFPGIIKPLIWSVNVPLVNGAWLALFTELIGPNDIEPESFAGRFYARAYFNLTALGQVFELLGLPRETVELLMGMEAEGPEPPSLKPSPKTYALLPGMIRFGLDKARFAGKIEAFLPVMEGKFRDFYDTPAAELGEEQLLGQIDRLYPLVQETAYYNTVTAMSMRVYSRILKGQLDRMGVDLESFDLTGDMQELQRFEPNVHLARLHGLYSALDQDLRARVRESRYEQLSTLPGTETLQVGIARFLEQFGHLSDSSSDFSREPWRENPDLILQMIVNYLPPEGGSSDKVRVADLHLKALQRPFFMTIYNRVLRFHWYREAVSSLFTFGYGLFRAFFLALGQHFVQRGLITRTDDVFYLYMAEIRELVETGNLMQDCQDLVWKRTEEVNRVRDIVPPDMVFGDHAPPLAPSQARILKGIPTSLGNYTGPARVLQGIQDLGRVHEGDVLVIPYSDVGWSPLFTKAGAVVAESGGILSHCSIIAREYGIPAVVSVTGACQVTDGASLTVDGSRGEIIVHEPAYG